MDPAEKNIIPDWLKKQGFFETAPERFWSKVNKNGNVPKHCPELGKCWEWNAGKDTYGYGSFFKGKKSMGMIVANKAA